MQLPHDIQAALAAYVPDDRARAALAGVIREELSQYQAVIRGANQAMGILAAQVEHTNKERTWTN